ncbi:4'-phosphopantetheinyl transferase family protein [Kroppenstedtia eburnea]
MLKNLLSKDEHERANRFAFVKDRNRFICFRGVLRCLLGRYMGQNPREVQIMYGEFGKPFLKQERIFFNVSHSHHMGLIGISRSDPLGVDIEQIRSFPEAQLLSEQFFSDREKRMIRQTQGDIKAFFRIWARKEAFIKALGRGLSQSLERFDVVDESGGWIEYINDSRGSERYQVRDLSVDPDYSAALCFQGNGKPHIRMQTFLLKSFF